MGQATQLAGEVFEARAISRTAENSRDPVFILRPTLGGGALVERIWWTFGSSVIGAVVYLGITSDDSWFVGQQRGNVVNVGGNPVSVEDTWALANGGPPGGWTSNQYLELPRRMQVDDEGEGHRAFFDELKVYIPPGSFLFLGNETTASALIDFQVLCQWRELPRSPRGY